MFDPFSKMLYVTFPTYLTLCGDSPSLTAGQVIPAADHALCKFGDVRGADLGQPADLAHRNVVSAERVTLKIFVNFFTLQDIK